MSSLFLQFRHIEQQKAKEQQICTDEIMPKRMQQQLCKTQLCVGGKLSLILGNGVLLKVPGRSLCLSFIIMASDEVPVDVRNKVKPMLTTAQKTFREGEHEMVHHNYALDTRLDTVPAEFSLF